MTTMRCLVLVGILAWIDVAAAQTSAPIATSAACLSQSEVHGGYPKYRVIGGRRCWYASVRGADQPAHGSKRPQPLDVDPYGDPIWQGSTGAATKLEEARLTQADCEEQALKLDAQEKRTFMKQCMSGRK